MYRNLANADDDIRAARFTWLVSALSGAVSLLGTASVSRNSKRDADQPQRVNNATPYDSFPSGGGMSHKRIVSDSAIPTETLATA